MAAAGGQIEEDEIGCPPFDELSESSEPHLIVAETNLLSGVIFCGGGFYLTLHTAFKKPVITYPLLGDVKTIYIWFFYNFFWHVLAPDKELLQVLKQKQIPYQLLDKEQFSRYSTDKKNQGIVAFIRNYDYVSLTSLLSCKPRGKFPLIIMLDGIEDPHNFGAILRTAAALNIDGVIIAKKNQVPVNSTVVKVSVGGVAQVPVCQIASLPEALNELKKNGYQIIATISNSISIPPFA
ncbi:797_t:CDS:2 [Racocetra fulgida]|uniref:797_t:CDS:1 n=1 Tax=Racocetra fulgida TaxID=60492 RepID=A0A9N8YUR7_9GLOM|nr:797_t:CDS:2 [Racocetra fulgida]